MGRLQTERDKLRVIEGLEGASAEAGAKFDRAKMESTLAGLTNRVFLMNNVHGGTPTVFQSRWALSYLAGPLTRAQISKLMAERKAKTQATASASAAATAPLASSLPPPPTPSPQSPRASSRPLLSADVRQQFWPAASSVPQWAKLSYRPALLGRGRLHFVNNSEGVDVWRDFAVLQSFSGEPPQPMWGSADSIDKLPDLASDPAADATFAELPGALAQPKNYRTWKGDLEDYAYQRERLTRWRCALLDESSRPDETEADFHTRAGELVREKRDAARDRVLAKHQARTKRLEEQVRRAEARVAEQKSRFWTRLLGMFWRVVEVLGMAWMGRRSRKQLVTSTSAAQTMQSRRQSASATTQLEEAQHELEEAQRQQEDELAALDVDYQPAALKFEKTETAPRKADIDVDEVSLVWLPWWIDQGGTAHPAYQ